mgnify:CR=1 FL=1
MASLELINLPGALFGLAEDFAALPEDNVAGMARSVQQNMYRLAPKNRPRVYGSAVLVRKPTAYSGRAATAVVGRGFAVLAEHGSWRHPHGFPIYPKAMTVNRRDKGIILKDAAGAKSYASVRAAKIAASKRGKMIADRNLKQVLAIGKNKGSGQVRFARYVRRHPALRPMPYVARAVMAAQANADMVVGQNVAKALSRPMRSTGKRR